MMDSYTKKTKVWLDKRFKKRDRRGVYLAHNPIYGFLNNPDHIIGIESYSRTFQVMDALSRINFKTLLDVGGAEGYYPFVAREIFDAKCRNCDLSLEAGKRAKEIFGIESDFCDAHNLPYKDGQFDVVICSETLEHVTNREKAISELLRVAKKAVVICVPQEPESAVIYNIKKKVPHGHIHSYNIKSFDYLKAVGYKVLTKRINSVFINIPDSLIRAKHIGFYVGRYPRIFFDIYNKILVILKSKFSKRVLKLIFNVKIVEFLINVDGFVCKLTHLNHDILVVIPKDPRLELKKRRNIAPKDIIGLSVPV